MPTYKNVQIYQIQDTTLPAYGIGIEEDMHNFAVDEIPYIKVFDGLLESKSRNTQDFLEEIFRMCNMPKSLRHKLYLGRGMSTSDVVIVDTMPFYCNPLGFISLNKFDSAKTIPLKNMMSVVYVEPGKPAYRTFIGKDLEDMQKAVGGYIEPISLEDDVSIIGNDSAKLIGMSGNRHIPGTTSIIAGPFFICGDDAEEFTDLPEDKISKYLEIFAEPENISQEEVDNDISGYKSLEDILAELRLNPFAYDEDNDEELNF